MRLYTVVVTTERKKQYISIERGILVKGIEEGRCLFWPTESMIVRSEYPQDLRDGLSILKADLVTDAKGSSPYLKIPEERESDHAIVLICWQGKGYLNPDNSNIFSGTIFETGIRVLEKTIRVYGHDRLVSSLIVELCYGYSIPIAPRKKVYNDSKGVRIARTGG
jgi:hypothetical protein